MLYFQFVFVSYVPFFIILNKVLLRVKAHKDNFGNTMADEFAL